MIVSLHEAMQQQYLWHPDGRLINDIKPGWYMNVNDISNGGDYVGLIPFEIYSET